MQPNEGLQGAGQCCCTLLAQAIDAEVQALQPGEGLQGGGQGCCALSAQPIESKVQAVQPSEVPRHLCRPCVTCPLSAGMAPGSA